MAGSRRYLPNPKHQPISNPRLVLGIALQISCEKGFLVQKSPYDHERDRNDQQQAPARAERQRHAEQHDQRGRALTASGKYDEAIAELTEAIRLQPDLARAYNGRGYVYLLKRDFQHALADFDDAIRLDPNYANAIANRATALRGLGKKPGQ